MIRPSKALLGGQGDRGNHATCHGHDARSSTSYGMLCTSHGMLLHVTGMVTAVTHTGDRPRAIIPSIIGMIEDPRVLYRAITAMMLYQGLNGRDQGQVMPLKLEPFLNFI